LEKLGFPWILLSESSFFNDLRGKFGGIYFVGVRRRDVRLVASALEIGGDAVNLVEQALPLFRPIAVFYRDCILVLVEPVNHPDERADGLEVPAPDRFSDETQGWHEAFELQMRVVGASIDDPLAENLRDDLADPLGADALLPGDLVIGPTFAQRAKMRFLRSSLVRTLSRRRGSGVCSID
jgi:hypothetical protein